MAVHGSKSRALPLRRTTPPAVGQDVPACRRGCPAIRRLADPAVSRLQGSACESTRARISSKEKPTAHSSQPFTESAKKNIKGRTQEVTQRSWVDTLAEKAEHQQSITETQKHH